MMDKQLHIVPYTKEHGQFILSCQMNHKVLEADRHYINVEGDAKKRKAAWSAAAHIGGKDISLWTSAYPSGFQPYRNSHFNYDEWEAAGYDRAFVEDYLGSNLDTYNHPNSLNEPRIPGIFQYYSVAEDELAKGYAGQYGSAQETADAIAVAWEKITDQIGRESQIKLYKAALGL